jgi:hypothetical protein
MINNWSAIERIERAERETPYCECGQPMVAIAHDGAIWLECTSLECRSGNAFVRLLSAIVSGGHDRQLIVEDAADLAQAA